MAAMVGCTAPRRNRKDYESRQDKGVAYPCALAGHAATKSNVPSAVTAINPANAASQP